MAISDELWLMAVGLGFNYFIIYRKNKLFGNLIFVLLGLGVAYIGTTATAGASQNMQIMVGIIIFIGGIMSLFIDIMKKLDTSR